MEANIFSWSGPEFLALYVLALVAATAIAGLARRALRGPFDEAPEDALELDAYETAFLAGGAAGATHAAIAALVNDGVLAADAASRTVATAAPLPLSAHPLERAVYAAAAEPTPIARLAGRTGPALRAGRLAVENGLVLTRARAVAARAVPAGVAALVALTGAIKIAVGVSRDRPVVFLVLLVGVAAAIAIAFLVARPHRTVRGDKALRDLRRRNAALATTARADPGVLGRSDVALALALFGPAVLAGSALLPLKAALTPPASPAGSSCAAATSGCGASCGGGGCGGCGGGS